MITHQIILNINIIHGTFVIYFLTIDGDDNADDAGGKLPNEVGNNIPVSFASEGRLEADGRERFSFSVASEGAVSFVDGN